MATTKKTTVTKAPRKRGAATVKETEIEEAPVVIADEPKKGWKVYLPWGLLVLSVLIMLFFIFKKNPKPDEPTRDDSALRTEIDSTKAALRELRELQSQQAAEKAEEGERLYKQPIINNHFYDERKKKFDAIPARIDTATKSELRRLFAKP